MTMTDPIADMLTRIRNGIQVRRKFVDVPSSKLKSAVALALKDEGYIGEIETSEDERGFGVLRLALKYDEDGRNAITEIKRVSKPGCRAYAGAQDVPVVRRGLGTTILSTSKGVMSHRRAKELCIGGEVLCSVF
ncbi:MAG: 30S ribosomal protein S8 [Planctomycetes bacterium]|nr:30S ribosomal protein S8 [Planctomycetota bacterium]MBL7007733.1 30S ribosomal protein S8 [Planctomycetota bacterium]